MKKYGLFFLVLLTAAAPACTNKEPKTTCIYGNSIPESDLDAILAVSDRLMDLVAKGDAKAVYEAGTEEMKAGQNRDMFTQAVDMFIKSFGQFEFPIVQEAYYMESESKEPAAWISCNLGEPGINDLYRMPANRKLAVVIYRVHTASEEMRIVFQLEKQDEQWMLRSVSINPMTLKHNLPEYYTKKAQELREQNHLHAAVLCYKTAALLSDIGMNVNEYTVNFINQLMGQIKVDYMPGGEVQMWSTGSGATYKVYNLDTAYDQGNLLVQASYLTPTLTDTRLLAKQAHDLATFLDNKYPEYRLVFDGFRITAAPERKEELMMSYHTVILFKDLPQPEAGAAPTAPAPAPTAPAPAPTTPAPQPAPGATAQTSPAPPQPAPAQPAPEAPASPSPVPPAP